MLIVDGGVQYWPTLWAQQNFPPRPVASQYRSRLTCSSQKILFVCTMGEICDLSDPVGPLKDTFWQLLPPSLQSALYLDVMWSQEVLSDPITCMLNRSNSSTGFKVEWTLLAPPRRRRS